MDRAQVEAGTVFAWPGDERPMRVLLRDAEVAMYDAWWPHLQTWGLGDLKRTRRKRVSYYVTDVTTLAAKATFLRTEPLTDDETALHRPDLRFSLAQCAEVQWPAEAPDATVRFTEHLRASGCWDALAGSTLNVPEIYLLPFGPDGGTKAGVRVKADTGIAFTARELISKAATIEAPWVRSVVPTQGVGIYRSGLQRGLPAYYLWGNESRLQS
ncbi:hypothetical protein GCM10010191_00910 [Actinomadura vinacea]|uniref:Uncharacterized protein n=1 Tax=Actinomadura vinacea TaxID=115336 RepID=A0ABN3IB32_9ACTN